MRAIARHSARTCLFLLAGAVSCNDSTTDAELQSPVTSIVVRPEAFLGDLGCAEQEGALARYQATLLDVTEGLDQAEAVPSSPIVSCFQQLWFENVEPGHSYIARVSAFDQLDVQAREPGEPIAVDSAGMTVGPRWSTTCWGDDASLLGLGGASSSSSSGLGGAGGASSSLGVQAFEETEVTMRGCEPLDGDFDPQRTGVSVDIAEFLAGYQCGSQNGEISQFFVDLPPSPEDGMAADFDPGSSSGGAGGQGGASGKMPMATPCGEVATFTGLLPGTLLSFQVHAEEANSNTSHSTTCIARLSKGVIVPATCDPLR